MCVIKTIKQKQLSIIIQTHHTGWHGIQYRRGEQL